MAYENILLDVTDKIATITLNRPERLNACGPAMAEEISDAVSDLEGARCLIITGAGKGFCSGADLQARSDTTQTISGGQASYNALTRFYNPMILKLARLNMPIITAVNGAAAGVGCSIGLSGDFVFAGRKAYFLQAFVNIGLVPDGGASWVLPRLIGKARATRMMMLGERIGADQAEEWGMIYKACDDETLLDEARTLATRLASGPTVAYSVMRKNILTALENSLAEALLAEAEGQFVAGSAEDAAEGTAAFVEKRKAEFKGR